MNKRILVLGASGLLGHHCIKELETMGFEVFGTYNQTQSVEKGLIPLDAEKFSELNAVIKKYKPDVVINTIAFVTVDGCEINPSKANILNNEFVAKIIDSLNASNLKESLLVQISSDSVYGNTVTHLPWKEDDATNPLSVYAETKLSGEYQALKWPKSLILRTAFYGINPNSTKSLLWWIIDNAKKGNTLEGWENIYFSPISASQLAICIGNLIKKNITGLFNVGSSDTCNKYDFVSLVCQQLKLPVQIDRINVNHEKAIRPNYSVLDSSQLTKALNWKIDWKTDLIQYMDKMSKLI